MSIGIKTMFDRISSRYDFLNHFLSLGRDLAWRNKAASLIHSGCSDSENLHRLKVLDLCGGTGDFLRALQRKRQPLESVVIADFSLPMLRQARKKSPPRQKSMSEKWNLVQMDALMPSFKTETFDVILCAYGMRNLDSLQLGLANIRNLLKPDGLFITLEFFRPNSPFTRFFFGGLAPLAIPIMARLFSGQRMAYEYLVQSVLAFYSVGEYQRQSRKEGFREIRAVSCDFGLSHIVIARK